MEDWAAALRQAQGGEPVELPDLKSKTPVDLTIPGLFVFGVNEAKMFS
jgi:hypothetical protein